VQDLRYQKERKEGKKREKRGPSLAGSSITALGAIQEGDCACDVSVYRSK